MAEWQWGPGIRSRRVAWRLLAFLRILAVVPAALATQPHGENVHRPEASCLACHTVEREALNDDRRAAPSRLAPDLEARCLRCHSDEGPSHHTGIRPVKPVPDVLPLSVDGLITCATCHFVHGDQAGADYFLRIDNARGKLCLTCHELSELQ